MLLKKGIHFYINIKNYEKIIEAEENNTGKVTHSVHALDRFFKLIESYASSKNATIEKITGSRLHLFLEGELQDIKDAMFMIAVYSNVVAQAINGNYKYNSIKNFLINVGASYGEFYYEHFNEGDLDEDTSFGFPCNFAAKLETKSNSCEIAIDEHIYNSFADKIGFIECNDKDFQLKYNNGKYYKISIDKIDEIYFSQKQQDKVFDLVNEKVNDINLSDIEIVTPNDQPNFENCYLKNVYKLNGIAFYSDIRNFTSKFNDEGFDLSLMSSVAKNALINMYKVLKNSNGLHVQFQGDREFGIFYNKDEQTCAKQAVSVALHLIDTFSTMNYGLKIGIGESFGNLYVTKFGIRNHKDIAVLGSSLFDANEAEDKFAKENELVITENIYLLIKSDKVLASLFEKIPNTIFYKTKYGFTCYRLRNEQNHSQKLFENNMYNGAWSPNGRR